MTIVMRVNPNTRYHLGFLGFRAEEGSLLSRMRRIKLEDSAQAKMDAVVMKNCFNDSEDQTFSLGFGNRILCKEADCKTREEASVRVCPDPSYDNFLHSTTIFTGPNRGLMTVSRKHLDLKPGETLNKQDIDPDLMSIDFKLVNGDTLKGMIRYFDRNTSYVLQDNRYYEVPIGAISVCDFESVTEISLKDLNVGDTLPSEAHNILYNLVKGRERPSYHSGIGYGLESCGPIAFLNSEGFHVIGKMREAPNGWNPQSRATYGEFTIKL